MASFVSIKQTIANEQSKKKTYYSHENWREAGGGPQILWQNLEMLRWGFLCLFWATSAFPVFLVKPGNGEVCVLCALFGQPQRFQVLLAKPGNVGVGFFVSILGDLSVSRFFGKTWKC